MKRQSRKKGSNLRYLLITELVKTSKKIQEYDKGLPNLDPYCKEETYESWSLEELERSLKDDVNLILDFGENWNLPENLKYVVDNVKEEKSN